MSQQEKSNSAAVYRNRVILTDLLTERIFFSEGTYSKWIFDVEVEKLRAGVLFPC
jgi:hypothetical protein